MMAHLSHRGHPYLVKVFEELMNVAIARHRVGEHQNVLYIRLGLVPVRLELLGRIEESHVKLSQTSINRGSVPLDCRGA